ncbi:MAG: flavodoxin-dependent (E)-4-hydroxy-3-methylbut-2-enyl-diphosphate synthase [Planctomycetota bacterium]|jgi:(E)-4-hydroxy-3-methylbut-2-enyl-diphosphate synthase
MIKRRKTLTVRVGSVKIGSRAEVSIQSMTKVPTVDVNRCLRQIRQLAETGCALVRVAVPTRADTEAFEKIVGKSPVPLIADVHFSPDRAIEAIEAGAAKIRLNPGNIKDRKDIVRIIDCAKVHKVAIRVGVNEASIRDLKKQDIEPGKRVVLMLREMRRYVRLFEKRSFGQIVLSAKSSDTLRTIEVNRRISAAFDYPLHLGLTHAGLPEDATIPSAVALGTLLAEGIGDTIRVSAAGDPLIETRIAKQILTSIGLYHGDKAKVELIVCPTCARAQIDIVGLARRVEKAARGINKSVRLAVMGCIVNGPGEAADSDLAICAGKNKGYLYRHGKRICTVDQDKIIPALLKELEKL